MLRLDLVQLAPGCLEVRVDLSQLPKHRLQDLLLESVDTREKQKARGPGGGAATKGPLPSEEAARARTRQGNADVLRRGREAPPAGGSLRLAGGREQGGGLVKRSSLAAAGTDLSGACVGKGGRGDVRVCLSG